MRNFLLLFLFICTVSRTNARPSRMDQRNINLNQIDEREAEEVEYGNNEENPAEKSFQDEEEASLNDQDLKDSEPNQDDEQELADEAARDRQRNNLNEEKYMSRIAAEEHPDQPINERLTDYSQTNGQEKSNEETPNDPLLKRRQSINRYIESGEPGDGPEMTQHLANKATRMQNDIRDNYLDKRTIDARKIASDDSQPSFNSLRIHRNNLDSSQYNSDNAESSEKNHRLKQYYNTMQSDHKGMIRDGNNDVSQFMMYRDRRQAEAKDASGFTSTTTEEEPHLSDSVNEDDEAAIKRHIKKLSGEELEELLNSLSDEKKALLNKIMDSNRSYDNLNKREITKKAEAMEGNGYMDVEIAELNKLQAVSSSIDGSTESASGQSSDPQETKQEVGTESNEMSDENIPSTIKSEVSENKPEVVGSDATSNMNFNGDNKNIVSPNLQLAKSEIKREVNTDYLRNQDDMIDDLQISDNYIGDVEEPSHEQDRSCVSQEEDLSQLVADEAQLHQEFKREVVDNNQIDFDDSIKSLEDSFPRNDRVESGQYVESNMAPLIRVKRKDHKIRKTADTILPDGKAAFVPYKAENDDEDNDEGSEFDDDGFFDRTANIAKSNVNKPNENSNNYAIERNGRQLKQYDTDKDITNIAESSPENKLNSESRSIGSDTDSVLSGVEGVDDNLMFSSGTRNKRTLQGDRNLRSTPCDDPANKQSENHINIPNYQENDAFGALPRSYEGELGRYKRIRRVRPLTEASVPDD